MLFSMANIGVSQDGKVLNVPYVHQIGNTCWAASSTEILQYYGRNVRLCEFIEYTHQTTTIVYITDDGNHIRFRNCNNCCYNGTVHDSCTYIGYASEITNGLSHWSLHPQINYRILSFDECKNLIDNGRPFIIRWSYSILGDNNQEQWCGHIIVTRGYAENERMLFYIDSNDGYHICSYEWMKSHTSTYYKSGPEWDWTLTLSDTPQCESSNLTFTRPITSSNQYQSKNNIDASSTISGNNVKFEFGNEFVANPGFEVKLGSTVEINPNKSLKCK